MYYSWLNLVASGIVLAASSNAQITQAFVPAAPCPTCQSPNYVGQNNVTLKSYNGPVVPGKAFNRFIQIWMENTDFATAAGDPTFQSLASQGILLNSYFSLSHPSEPNYIAAMSGDFYGMGDDLNWHIPMNISTIVDLLEAKNISWASYQENMPYTAFPGDFLQKNYLNASAGNYTYYKRKNNGLVIYDSITNDSSRAYRLRNWNDFAADVNASALPQWSFFTPNLVNNAHDTTIGYCGSWLNFWLKPLLANPNFNAGSGSNGTLILLTFDEALTNEAPNQVWSLLLGSAIPPSLRGTNDSTLYSHYSTLSTVEANWDLGNLGRNDLNKTLANIFNFVAPIVNYTNTNTSSANVPQTNLTRIFPGPLNPVAWVDWVAPPNVTQFGGPTFYRPGTNHSITLQSLAAPINVSYAKSPSGGIPSITYAKPLIGSTGNSTTTSPSGSPTPSQKAAANLSFSVNSMVLALGMVIVGCALTL